MNGLRVARTRFDQNNARAVLTQPVRQHAAGRAGADNDVVGGDGLVSLGILIGRSHGFSWDIGML